MEDSRSKIYPVIMSGGAGTRLWPVSRKAIPKQYHKLVSDLSMFEETVARLKYEGDVSIADPVVICAEGHQNLIRSQSESSGLQFTGVIVEPVPRNTAAVGAVAACYIKQTDPEGIILLLPADHHIDDIAGFWDAVLKGAVAARKGYLTTFGIQPTGPETGFGYIRRGSPLFTSVYAIEEFKEKPDYEVASQYLESGDYFWNAGIFLFSVNTVLREYEKHAVDILKSSQAALLNATVDELIITLHPDNFSDCRSESIDYAIMESTDHAAIVAPVDIGWNDIGSWGALYDLIAEKRAADLVEINDVISVDCKRSLIRSDGPLVAAVGVEDLIIIATDEAVLVARNTDTQKVKKVVEQLKARNREELL